jgi:hypothetical protein
LSAAETLPPFFSIFAFLRGEVCEDRVDVDIGRPGGGGGLHLGHGRSAGLLRPAGRGPGAARARPKIASRILPKIFMLTLFLGAAAGRRSRKG